MRPIECFVPFRDIRPSVSVRQYSAKFAFLLPTGNTALRCSLDQWFDAEGISPKIQAEIEDSALLKTFGSGGAGLFVAPTAVETEIQRQYDVEVIGRIDAVRERFDAITISRKLKHPAVTAILDNATEKLF